MHGFCVRTRSIGLALSIAFCWPAFAQPAPSVEQILAQVEQATPAERAGLLLEAARIEQMRSLDRARELAQQALAVATAVKDSQALFDAHTQLGNLELLATRPAAAEPHLAALTELLRDPALAKREAEFLLLRGRHALVERRNDMARSDLERAAMLAAAQADQSVLAKALHNQALLQIRLGAQAAAEPLLEQSLRLNEANGREREADVNRHYLGIIARDRGDYARAMGLHHEVLKHAEARDDVQSIAHSANALGILHSHQNQIEESIHYYQRARTAYGKLADRYSEAMALINIGDARSQQKRFIEALAPLQEALAIAIEQRNEDAEILARAELSSAYTGAERYAEAAAEATRAVQLAARGTPLRQYQATTALAEVKRAQQQFGESARLYEQALELARSTGRQNEVASSLQDLAKTEAKLGRMADAYTHAQQAAELQSQLHDEELTRRVAELQEHYAAEKREAELAVKQARIESLEQQANQQRWIRYLLALALVSFALLVLSMASRARSKRHAERELRAQHALVERANLELAEAADSDALTRVRNRRFLQRELLPRLNAAQQQGRLFALVVIDADRFKSINDRYGHECGDAALVAIVQAWRGVLSESDSLVRLGGEEFLAILFDRDADGVRALVEAGLRAVRATLVENKREAPALTVSAGWTCGPWRGADISWLLRLADHAMLQAKRDGRDRAYGLIPNADALGNSALPESLFELAGTRVDSVQPGDARVEPGP